MGINVDHLRTYIVVPTLVEIGLYSESAVNLLLGTCAQESKMGTYLRQINGIALGIYQIEPATHDDIWTNFLQYKPDLRQKIIKYSAKNDAALISNLTYATAIARIHYLRAPEKLPAANDVLGIANYYKKYYNSFKGKATVNEFILNYKRYVATHDQTLFS